MLQVALDHHRGGRLVEAEKLYRRVLKKDAARADAWFLLSVLAMQSRRYQETIGFLRHAIRHAPNNPQYHSNLGEAQRRIGQSEEAAQSFGEAIRLKPDLAEAHFNLALALHAQSKLPEAIASYRRALSLRPDLPGAEFRLARALMDSGRLNEAVSGYERALARDPRSLDALIELGMALYHSARFDEAIARYQQALEIDPNSASIHNNLGCVMRDLDRPDDATACYRRALELDPKLIVAHSGLGTMMADLGRSAEAIACYRRALELKPDDHEAHSNLVYTLSFHPEASAGHILEEARAWERTHASGIAASAGLAHENDRAKDRRLRVGYVSPDFRQHVWSLIALPAIARHDPEVVEVFCYSNVLSPDAITDRVRGHASVFRDIVGVTDARAAELIRSDRIDVLVDLTMHMERTRLRLFAYKPAPVQVTWFAYPGTTGLSSIDYRLTDPYLDPPSESGDPYAEQSFRLPHSFWCYDPMTSTPDVGPLPAGRYGHITFGCLNNFRKITNAVIELWARVLTRVERSRLVMLAPAGEARRQIHAALAKSGVDPSRVEFVSRRPRHEYLAAYQQIDIGLDTFPYNGHTTSLDAFWMGVPVITLVGKTIVGRAGFCQAMNLGLPELAAWDDDDFVRIAVELSSDPERLPALRSTLRSRMEQSPLMDAPRFARDLEAAYRTMWRRWCERDG
jgi:predicted O-linked N-acetylglucosamine transferase (SPINDLY family)